MLLRLNKTKRLLFACCLAFSGLTLMAQCPEITINEKYDHVQTGLCVTNGWDTLVDCNNATIILNATPFITTQHFNGTYLVEEIPYNPVDTTFHAGSRLNISTDDAWENATISFPFTFMFFGQPYTQAVVGSNGIVSFNSSVAGNHCAYMYNTPIPHTSFTSGSDNSYNAIYGVYEDIDPAYLQNPTTCGMFRSVGGTYPCRYLCASVNGVDLYGNHNHYNTYQIVCYEGTNIIEVHIKQRHCCSTTNSGKGLIGIQNSNGQNQVSHYHQSEYLNDPSFYIQANSPGAFVAPGRNGWTGETTYEAWRFTPQGETSKNIRWWRLFTDAAGNIVDSVELSSNVGDTNGYYMNTEHTQVSVSPTRTTKYVVQCIYRGANNYLHGVDNRSMRDTITVGVDTAKTMSLTADPISVCEGESSTIMLHYPQSDQTLDSCTWSATRILNGQRVQVPNAVTSNFITMQYNSAAGDHIPNQIDTTWIYCTAKFGNGCNNYDSIRILTYPNYEFFDTVGLCRGDSYRWYNVDSTRYIEFNQPQTSTDTSRHYYSVTQCDSTEHLRLVVSDISFSTDRVLDCKEYTWLNGRTYSANNDETREQDTVVLKNKWGCDSTVTLDFTIIPMKAIIGHDPEVATIDELSIELTDLSYGHDSRVWLLPNNQTSTLPETSIIFPLTGMDVMDVRLAVHNNYGCDDTALVSIPLMKVTEYVPNVFTPDKETNNRFYPSLQGNVNDVRCYIYNRRGEQVCYFEGPDGYWDGTDMQGRKCPQGAYVYVMRYVTILEPDVTQVLKGAVTLIR